MKQIIENRIKNYKETVKTLIEENKNDLASYYQGRIELLQSILDEYKTQQTVNESVTYKIGQRFKRRGEILLLVQTEYDKACLIGTEEGNRLLDPITVKDTKAITKEELEQMYYKHLGELKIAGKPVFTGI